MSDQLTEREQEVYRLLAEGYNAKEIARKLKISRHTTQAHIASIYRKLGVHDRTNAMLHAWRNGDIQ